MDRNEIKAALKLFINTEIKRKAHDLPNGPVSFNHIGDESFEDTEHQWWRVSFGMGSEVQMFPVRISYSKWLNAVQIELYGLKGRTILDRAYVQHHGPDDGFQEVHFENEYEPFLEDTNA